jgi:hypothetical protein
MGRTNSDTINKRIYKIGSKLGPSKTNLFLYGPIGPHRSSNYHNSKIILNSESIEILEANKEVNDAIYNSYGRRYEKMLFNRFIYGDIEEHKPFDFKTYTDEEFKDLCLQVINKEQLYIESNVHREINDPSTNIGLTQEIKFSADLEKNVLLIQRRKSLDSLIEKYERRYNSLNKDEQKRVDMFHVDLINDDETFWLEKNHDFYQRKYPEIKRLMLNDEFGLTISYLERNNSGIFLDYCSRMGKNMEIDNFYVVKHKVKSYRGSEGEGKPGGMHYTLTHKDHPNFPFEVKICGPKSLMYMFYGKHSHINYAKTDKDKSKKTRINEL